MNKVMVFILIGVLLAGCSNSSSPNITHVYAFGDEQSDMGKCIDLVKEAIDQGEADPIEVPKIFNLKVQDRYGGRLTNGPVAVEVLADRLGVPLTDYAVCMAMSDHYTLLPSAVFDNTGLLGQIDQFEKDLNGKEADPNALYTIQIGGVDLFHRGTSNTATAVISNIATAIRRLAELGAKHILVGNAFNMSKFPGFTVMGIARTAEEYQTLFNETLPGELETLAEELNADIEIFDITAVENSIQSHPENYGITNLTEPCTHLGSGDGVTDICTNPDAYYYWGYFYPTRHVHEILGEAMAEQLSK